MNLESPRRLERHTSFRWRLAGKEDLHSKGRWHHTWTVCLDGMKGEMGEARWVPASLSLLLVYHEETFLPQTTMAMMFCSSVQTQAQWTEPLKLWSIISPSSEKSGFCWCWYSDQKITNTDILPVAPIPDFNSYVDQSSLWKRKQMFFEL